MAETNTQESDTTCVECGYQHPVLGIYHRHGGGLEYARHCLVPYPVKPEAQWITDEIRRRYVDYDPDIIPAVMPPRNMGMERQVNHECNYRRRFISSRGNEYFCEIDEEYLTDRFNLTGLNTEVQYYQYALDLVTDVFDLDCDDDMRETIEKSARHLYGLVHARYIVTTRGLAKMLEKYKKNDFGKCPRVMCKSQALLPMGQSDNPNLKAVKLYCAKCEDIYNPKSSRHAAIDGAYFGTSFHNILFQVYPALIPAKSYERFTPRIYGFKVHAPAALIRWQNSQRDDMRRRLRKLEVDSGFKDDEVDVEEDEEEEEEEDGDVEGVIENGAVEQEAKDAIR